jgi:hypothetical protein
MVRLVCLPLVYQPRLDKSPEDQFSRHGRLRLQGHQEFREPVHGEIDSFCKFHERQRVPLVGWPGVGLDHRRVQVRQEIGGDLSVLDGFRDAMQQPGLEGCGGAKHPLPHAMVCKAVDRWCSVSMRALPLR